MVSKPLWNKTLFSCRSYGFLIFGSISTYHQQKEARITLHWRAHLLVEAEFDSGHFPFLTYHYCEILGIFKEDGFSSEPNIGFLPSSKWKFRDQDRCFWLGKTLGKSNANLTLDQKISTTKDNLQIQYRNLKLVRSKSPVFSFEVLITLVENERLVTKRPKILVTAVFFKG